MRIERYPEESTIRRIDDLSRGIRALKHPVRVARLRIDFVPPSESDEPAAGDVLEVVEVGCQKEDRDDEDENAVAPSQSQFPYLSSLR